MTSRKLLIVTAEILAKFFENKHNKEATTFSKDILLCVSLKYNKHFTLSVAIIL